MPIAEPLIITSLVKYALSSLIYRNNFKKKLEALEDNSAQARYCLDTEGYCLDNVIIIARAIKAEKNK